MQRKCADWLDSWMKYAARKETPELMKLWIGISVVAACLQRKTWCQWDKQVYPNLYVVLVGPAGGARKGTTMSPARALLKAQDSVRLGPNSITREALIKALERSVQNCKDDTQHSSMTIWSQEFAVFLSQNNPALISDLTDLYDCEDPFIYETKGQGVNNISNPWVNLIGATTPDILQRLLPVEAIGGGLTSRTIFVYGDNGSIEPYPIETPQEKALFADLSDDLQDIVLMEGQFRMTDAFIEKHANWYIHHRKNPVFDDPKLEYYLTRRPTHLLKLCMVVSASEGTNLELTPAIHDRAIGILELTEAEMPNVFAGYGRLDLAQVINQVIKFIRNAGPVSMNDIRAKFLRDATKDDLKEILDNLVAANLVEFSVDTGYRLKTKEEVA